MGKVIELRPLAAPAPEPLWREAVGEQLREERVFRDERIVDVAGRAGVSPQYLSELERGRKDPSSEVLSAVSGALGLTVLELTRRAGRRLAPVVLGASGAPGASGVLGVPRAPVAPGARGPVCLAA